MAEINVLPTSPIAFRDTVSGCRSIDIQGSFGDFHVNSEMTASVSASADQFTPSITYDKQEFSAKRSSFEKTALFSAGLNKPFEITLKVDVDAISVSQSEIGPFALKSHNDGTKEIVRPQETALNRTIYQPPWVFDFTGCCVLIGPWGEKKYSFSIPRDFYTGNPNPNWRLDVSDFPPKIRLSGRQQLQWTSSYHPRLVEDIVDGVPIAVYTGGEAWLFNYPKPVPGTLTDGFNKIVESRPAPSGPKARNAPKKKSGRHSLRKKIVLPPLRGKAKEIADYIDKRPGKLGQCIADDCHVHSGHFRRVYLEKLRPRGYSNARDGEGYFPPPQNLM
jgi:hypothetical protein